MLSTWWLVGAAVSPHIELYTMGQGQHLFERFGHAAICVVSDDAPRASRCYNYGTTDFASPPQELGWGFLRGDARFWVSVSSLDAMLRAYALADRDVFRQRLPLSATQVRWMASALAHDAREENRYYIYHHFRDNCATRVRDLVDQATAGRLSRPTRPLPVTHRDVTRQGLAEHALLLLASDLLLGRDADRPLSEYEGMFLPVVLREAVARELRALPEQVHARQGTPFPQDGPDGRGAVALASAVLLGLGGLSTARPETRAARVAWGVLRALAAVIGLLAAALWAVAVLSRVPELYRNEALLVFVPTDVAAPLLNARDLRRYARVRLVGLLAVAILLALGALLQPLHALILVPFAVFATLALRSVTRVGPAGIS